MANKTLQELGSLTIQRLREFNDIRDSMMTLFVNLQNTSAVLYKDIDLIKLFSGVVLTEQDFVQFLRSVDYIQ